MQTNLLSAKFLYSLEFDLNIINRPNFWEDIENANIEDLKLLLEIERDYESSELLRHPRYYSDNIREVERVIKKRREK